MSKKIVLTIAILVFTGLASAGTISTSNVNYDDGNEELLVEFLVDGTGETLHASVDSSQISNAAPGDTTKDLEIEAELLNAQAEYEVQDHSMVQIMDLEFTESMHDSESARDSWVDSNCAVQGVGTPYVYTGLQPTLSGVSYFAGCFVQDSGSATYNVGVLQNPPDSTFEAEWNVKASGEIEQASIISNNGVGEGQQSSLGPHVDVQWLSLRDLGSSAPNPQSSYAAYSSTGDDWELIQQSNYEDYTDFLSDGIPERIEEAAEERPYTSSPDDLLRDGSAEASSYYTNAKNPNTVSPIYSAERPEASSIEDGVWKLDAAGDLEWFVSDFLVRVDGADYLEVERNPGTPRIIDAEGAEVDGLTTGTAEVQVENIGQGSGLFEAQVSCTEDFTSIGATAQASLDPGETHTFYPTIEADGDEEMSGSCTVTVEDRESFDSDVETISVGFTPEQECTPGSQFVEVDRGDDLIKECDSDGISTFVVERCEGDEEAVAGGDGYVCAEQDSSSGFGDGGSFSDCQRELMSVGSNSYTFTDPVCVMLNSFSDVVDSIMSAFNSLSQGVGWIGSLLDGLVALLGGLVGFVLGRRPVSRVLEMSDFTDRRGLKLGVSLVLAVVFALIAYSLFSQWWMKLLLVVIGVVAVYFGLPLLKMLGLGKLAS